MLIRGYKTITGSDARIQISLVDFQTSVTDPLHIQPIARAF